MSLFNRFIKYDLLILPFIVIFLSSCAQLKNIYQEPEMTSGLEKTTAVSKPKIENYKTSQQPDKAFYQRPAALASYADNGTIRSSLWQSGPSSLFGDRRAKQVGDILTVNIEINDRAQFDNSIERQRTSNNQSSVTAALGINEAVEKILPGPFSLEPGVTTSGNSTTTGDGSIDRSETINLKIAAIVTDILQNGNMIIQGSQEVRVNFELRDLQVTGLIRPEDISRNNTISYDKVAEARISYGGRGQVSNLQQPRIGDQLMDIVSPF